MLLWTSGLLKEKHLGVIYIQCGPPTSVGLYFEIQCCHRWGLRAARSPRDFPPFIFSFAVYSAVQCGVDSEMIPKSSARLCWIPIPSLVGVASQLQWGVKILKGSKGMAVVPGAVPSSCFCSQAGGRERGRHRQLPASCWWCPPSLTGYSGWGTWPLWALVTPSLQ